MVNESEYDCLLSLVRKRRTVRQFKPDPVPDEHIAKIIEVARWAPSAFHTQPWEFVVIKNQEVKNKIVAVLERSAPPIKDRLRRTYRSGVSKMHQFLSCCCAIGGPKSDCLAKHRKIRHGWLVFTPPA